MRIFYISAYRKLISQGALKHGFDLYPELLQLLKSYSDVEILRLVDTISKSKLSAEPLSEKDAFMLASLIKNLDSRHSIRICLLGLKRIPAEATYPPLAAFLYERGITAEELIKLRDTHGNSKEKIADINDILLIYKEGFFVSGSPTNEKTPLKQLFPKAQRLK